MSAAIADEHSVWAVYDLRKTALLNSKYYAEWLSRYERRNFWIELTIAASASTTVGGFWLWTTDSGKILWSLFGGLAALLSIAKPFLKLTDKIRKTEKVQTGYEALNHDLFRISVEIKNEKAYTPQMKKQFMSAIDKLGVLVKEQPKVKRDADLIRKLQDEVDRELPVNSFHVPSN